MNQQQWTEMLERHHREHPMPVQVVPWWVSPPGKKTEIVSCVLFWIVILGPPALGLVALLRGIIGLAP